MSTQLSSVRITFVRETEDGQSHTITADLDAETGYNQWGAPVDVLGDNVGVLEEILRALDYEGWTL